MWGDSALSHFAAVARAGFEVALERVALHEGVALPAPRQEPAQTP